MDNDSSMALGFGFAALFCLILFVFAHLIPTLIHSPYPFPTIEKKIDLNAATAKELASLPGVGPSLAQKIIDYREKNGKFTSPSELLKVDGIGSRKYNDLKMLVTVE
jgi:competence ComEA-like helix-hairpin-helix protein